LWDHNRAQPQGRKIHTNNGVLSVCMNNPPPRLLARACRCGAAGWSATKKGQEYQAISYMFM
jgi:hypothetical protein